MSSGPFPSEGAGELEGSLKHDEGLLLAGILRGVGEREGSQRKARERKGYWVRTNEEESSREREDDRAGSVVRGGGGEVEADFEVFSAKKHSNVGEQISVESKMRTGSRDSLRL